MNRHLLPNEIDILLDGEAGFGSQPLLSHVRHCEGCRAEFEKARELVRDLEHLPHYAPSPRVTAEIMASVQIFVPWHIALADTVRSWLPQSRPARVVAGVGFGSAALILSLATVWLLARLDVVMFAIQFVVERARESAVAAISGVLSSLFGAAAASALTGAGLFGVMLGILLVLMGAGLAVRTVRSVVSPRRERGMP
ncbi:MAG: hypothetical protein ABR543_14535 [Gemmatimonadaceae bacterium]